MMNVLALGLVVTSLLTAGIFTPTPEKHNTNEDVIVKEGHRVVVVEYEKDDGSTKVLISPQDSTHKADVEDKLSDKIERAEERFSPKELVCDAYGKCKDKVKGVVERTKEAVAHKAHETSDKVYEAEEDAKETVGEALSRARDKVTRVTDKASDEVHEAKDRVSAKGSEMKQGAKQRAQDAMDTAKKIKEEAEKKADEMRREGHKELREITREASEVALDVFHYVVSPERVASISKVAHLMGFSAAYGMCLWVTFASSYVLAGALSSRQQFSMVQSKIYTVYFKAMAYSICLALSGHLMTTTTSHDQRKKWLSLQGFNLVTSLGMILVNLLLLEPRATKVMHERMKKEKEEGRGKVDSEETAGRGSTAFLRDKHKETEAAAGEEGVLRLTQKLQRLNSYSSFLNVLTLTSMTWHLVHLAQRLDTATVC